MLTVEDLLKICADLRENMGMKMGWNSDGELISFGFDVDESEVFVRDMNNALIDRFNELISQRVHSAPKLN